MALTGWSRQNRAPLAAASFAAARIRARPTRGLVTGAGIAVAIGALFVTSASPLIAGDATLRRALDELAPGDRSVTVAVSVNTRTPEQLRQIGAQVRAGLTARGLGAPRAEVEYRALAATDGTVFRLAGVDGLAEVITLIDGRQPTACMPGHCEVVIIGADTAVTPPPDLGLDVVGRAVLDDPSILSGGFSPEPYEVILLGDGVEAVGSVQPLELIGRSLGWVAPIDPATVSVADIDSVLAAAARTANSFSQGGGTVDLPRRALVGARTRADTARHRVQLAAAQGVVLLVAFALLAAASARRQHGAARELLQRRGAGRAAVNVFTLCEAAWPVAIGLVVGIPLGLGVSAWIADAWGFDAGDVVADVAGESLVRVLLGAVAVLVMTALVMASPMGAAGAGRHRRRWWRPAPLDALGLGAFASAALGVGRGSATPADLVEGGDPLVAALPLLAGVTVAWVAIRAVPVLVAGASRLLGHRAPLARTALGEVARRPAVPLATAGFLAAATMLGLFSLGYRSTLSAGARDQAAFTVPLDITLTGGPALVRPSALEPMGGWSALTPNIGAEIHSTEIVRRGVTVHSRQLTNDTVTVIGMEPAALRELRGWRRDFGPNPSVLASAITPGAPPPTMGTALPADVARLVVHGSGDLRITDIGVIIERPDGTWHEVTTQYDESTPDSVVADLDPGDAGGRFVGFRLGQRGTDSAKIEHHLGEGLTSAASFTAAVHLDSVQAVGASASDQSDGAPLAIDWTALSSDGAVVTQRPHGVSVALRLQGSAALLVPSAPPLLREISAIVDPATAAAATNGLVVVDVPGRSRMTMRIAGVAERFPGAPTRFMIVDRAQIQLAFDLLDPGFGTANEVWLSVTDGDEARVAAAFERAPYDQLVVMRRAVIEASLRGNPLSRFTLGLFAVAGLIAGLLAVAGIHLATSSDATEQAPLHRALAAEGVAPGALSRMVRTSSIAIATGAILVGSIGALLLLRTVTRVITVTATSTVPVPPLVASVPALDLVVAIAALTVLCTLSAALAARAARRSAQGDLLREFG